MILLLSLFVRGIFSIDPITLDLLTPRKEFGDACGYDSCGFVKKGMLNVHIVPHTHAEVGYSRTFIEHYTGVEPDQTKSDINMKRILDYTITELWANEQRRFAFADMPYFFHWWSQRDGTVRRMVYQLLRQGRLVFIGGGWGMPEEATTSYHAIIDLYTYSLRKLNATFLECGRPLVAWQSDVMGHSKEFASLMAQMGFDALFFNPMSYDDELSRMQRKALEFLWRGSDDLGAETDIFSHKLFDGYWSPPGFCFSSTCTDPLIVTSDTVMSNTEERADLFIKSMKFRQAPSYNTSHVMVMMGQIFGYFDAGMWFSNIDKLIAAVNIKSYKDHDRKMHLMYSTPNCYLKAVHGEGPILETKQDDFYPMSYNHLTHMTGFYTSLPSVKLLAREGNVFLQIAKQMQVLAKLYNNDRKFEEIQWINGIFQDHNVISGQMIPRARKHYIKKMHDGIQKSTLILKQAFNKLRKSPTGTIYYRCQLNVSSCLNTEEHTQSFILIYNPLAWPVTMPVRIPITATDFYVTDPHGLLVDASLMIIPYPVLSTHLKSYRDSRYEIVFLAKDLPPLGYRSYFINQRKPRLRRKRENKKRKIIKKLNKKKNKTYIIRQTKIEDDGLLPDIDSDDEYVDFITTTEDPHVKKLLDLQLALPADAEEYDLIKESNGSQVNADTRRKFKEIKLGGSRRFEEYDPDMFDYDRMRLDDSNDTDVKYDNRSNYTENDEKIPDDIEKYNNTFDVDEELSKMVNQFHPEYRKYNSIKKLLIKNVGKTQKPKMIVKTDYIPVQTKSENDGKQMKPVKNARTHSTKSATRKLKKVTKKPITEIQRGGSRKFEEEYPDMFDYDRMRLDDSNDTDVKYDNRSNYTENDEKIPDDIQNYNTTFDVDEKHSNMVNQFHPDHRRYNPNKKLPIKNVSKAHKPKIIVKTEYVPVQTKSKSSGKQMKPVKNARKHSTESTTGKVKKVKKPSTKRPIQRPTATRKIQRPTPWHQAEPPTKEPITPKTRAAAEPLKESSDLFIENQYVRIDIDPTHKKVVKMSLSNGIVISLDIQFYYYVSAVAEPWNENNLDWKSPGVWIFRSPDNIPSPILEYLDVQVYKTGVVQELHSIYGQYASHVIRLYEDRAVLELDWLVGPVPYDDGVGKEVFIRYRTDLDNQGVFYTDANGRQTMKRIRDSRPQYVQLNKDSVAGNMYPVTSKIYIEDEVKNVRFTVFNDRAQAGTSLYDGEIDLMLTRTVLTTDSKIGVYLNETEHGRPVMTRGKHFLYLSKADYKPNRIFEKKFAKEIEMAPQIFVSGGNPYGNQSMDAWNKHVNELGFLNTKLPVGIHILTLQEWNDGTLLLRLENYLEKSDVIKSGIKTVFLSNLFTNIRIKHAMETTLAGHMWLREFTPLYWKKKTKFYKNFNKFYGNSSEYEFDEKDTLRSYEDIDVHREIWISPQQIRTFVCYFDYV